MAIIAQSPITAIQQAAVEYVESGLSLVAVNGKKAFLYQWNIQKNAITTVDGAMAITSNVGLA